MRDSDDVGRLGGDEFLAFLQDATIDDGLRVAQRMRRTAATALTFKNPETSEIITPTFSIGLAMVPDSALLGFDEMYGQADAAMYEAKQQGKNRISVIQP
jgi:diguanylate cyclase (GGDEF)-like protein